MRKFIDKLEQEEPGSDFFHVMELPLNGYTAVIGRAPARQGIPRKVTDNLFDMMLGEDPDKDPIDTAELLSPVDCARKLREWFLKPRVS